MVFILTTLIKHMYKLTGFALLAVLFASCQHDITQTKSFTVKNNLDMDRPAETVSVPVSEMKALVAKVGVERILIKDRETDSIVVTQALDHNADGTVDEILFQTSIKANGEKTFSISVTEDGAAQHPKTASATYSRFVPERTDDYAWENDRVAFRTYGPVAQRMVEEGTPGGTLTSGIDAWLKRVNYPIINKWYEGYGNDPMYYHTDRGEGYDPYHVGPSRGIGGIGVLVDDTLYVSKNFTGYKTIAEGPIRTVFELSYAPWEANGLAVNETKRISLDLGSSMMRVEEQLKADQPLPNVTIGITLHDKQGEVSASPEQGWFRYWEPMEDSFLGTGVVVAPELIQTYRDYRVKTRDQSHLYVVTRPKGEYLVYYAGFGWERSGQFKSVEEWDRYLSDFAKRVASPLEVTFKQ